MRRDPRTYPAARTRWTLRALRQAVPWVRLTSDGGMHRLLKRCGITWQRAQSFIRSPDPDYAAKLACVQAVRMLNRQAPVDLAVLYLDEVTIERQPSLAHTYDAGGRDANQPRARRSTQSNTLTRLVATLDHRTGQVVFRRASAITIPTLVRFYQDIVAAYPQAHRIYVVQDNWPVHYHPDVLVALEPQETRFTRALPPNWPTHPTRTAQQRWGDLRLPIQLVPLPTYASWCNPIEKLWRTLRQDLTHLHLWADDLARLRDEIDQFLVQFRHGTTDLLRYVGLYPG